jgi:hypothetical protein
VVFQPPKKPLSLQAIHKNRMVIDSYPTK